MSAKAPSSTPGDAIDAPADGTVVTLPNPDAELVVALAAAQASFPAIEKRNTATIPGKNGGAGYSYTYADLAEVLTVVRPVLAANGLALTQRTVRHEGRIILLTELRHVGGGIIVSEVEVGQSSGNPQQFGGALTYLRRYELVTLLGVAAEEDRDAQDVEPANTNGNRAPALPPWALEANTARKAELVDGLTALLDGNRETAKAIGKAIAANIGYVPDVVVGVISGVIQTRAQAAQAARQAQDAAAERPDPPAPEDPPAPRQTGPMPPTDEEAARAAAYQAEQAAPPAEDEDPELANAPADAGVDADEPLDVDDAAPSTIPAPARTGDVETDVANLRDLGCICEGPLADGSVPGAHDDACPIVGHGLPF